jgi:hypothetical protein
MQDGERELTYGEKMAGVNFNPSAIPVVDDVKKSAARFIDDIVGDTYDLQSVATPEQKLMLEQAVMLALQAQMLTVKAITYRHK